MRRVKGVLFALALALTSACRGGSRATAPLPTVDQLRSERLRLLPSGANLLFISAGGIGGGEVTATANPPITLNRFGDDVFEKSDIRAVYWANVPTGTQVTLAAVASSGSTFWGWFGTCSGTGPCVVSLAENVDVGVKFDQTPPSPRTSYHLSVDVLSSIQGLSPVISASGVALACGPGIGARVQACSADVPVSSPPSQVTLTASGDPAQPNVTFQGWGGQCSGTGSCTVTMDRDIGVTAGFGLSSTGGGGGTGGTGGGPGPMTWDVSNWDQANWQ